MACQHQIKDVAAGPADLRRVGVYVDRGGDGVTARGLQGPLAFDLDDANAAHARQAQVLVIAERGDADFQGGGRFEQGRGQRDGDRLAVDGQLDLLADGLGVGDSLDGAEHLAFWGPRRSRFHLPVVAHVRLLVACFVLRAWVRPRISSWKLATTESRALGADWPRPHLLASCRVSPRLQSSRR